MFITFWCQDMLYFLIMWCRWRVMLEYNVGYLHHICCWVLFFKLWFWCFLLILNYWVMLSTLWHLIFSSHFIDKLCSSHCKDSHITMIDYVRLHHNVMLVKGFMWMWCEDIFITMWCYVMFTKLHYLVFFITLKYCVLFIIL